MAMPCHSSPPTPVTIVIPARYGSTRLPGKPLILLNGKPMIAYVIEAALKTKADRVIVATDHESIAQVATQYGAIACMTSAHHACGTDRVIEVAKKFKEGVYVNVQGDEPLIDPESINTLIEYMLHHVPNRVKPSLVATLYYECGFMEAKKAASVKVVTDTESNALYFSRHCIPFISKDRDRASFAYKKHVGLYAYHYEALKTISRLSKEYDSPLSRHESLEQLRWLEAGMHIKALRTQHSAPGVDTPECVQHVEKLLRETPTGGSTASECQESLNARLRNIKALITDVDGVLTDGSLYYDARGESFKRFNVKDGAAVKMLRKARIDTAILSGRGGEALEQRMKELTVQHVWTHVEDKGAAFLALCDRLGVLPEEAASLGDDVIDLPAFAHAGICFAPSDADESVRLQADFVLGPGGSGVFREAAQVILLHSSNAPQEAH